MRRVLVILALIGFTLLAVIGIALILGETAPGTATTRFLALTAVLGVFSLTALAATIAFARSVAVGLGWVGLVSSAVALVLFIVLVLSDFPDESMTQLATVAGNLAGSAAFASLLLLVRGRDALLDGLIVVTWILLGLSFILAVVQLFGGLTGGVIKLVFTVTILTTLGMIAVPLVALWMGSGSLAAPAPPAQQPPEVSPPA